MLTPVGSEAGLGRSAARLRHRAEAERHMKKVAGKRIIADPIADFVGSTLPWAAMRGPRGR